MNPTGQSITLVTRPCSLFCGRWRRRVLTLGVDVILDFGFLGLEVNATSFMQKLVTSAPTPRSILPMSPRSYCWSASRRGMSNFPQVLFIYPRLNLENGCACSNRHHQQLTSSNRSDSSKRNLPQTRASRKIRMNARRAAALMPFVLAIWITGCGSNNNSASCRRSTAGVSVSCATSAGEGRSPMPDSPFAPRL